MKNVVYLSINSIKNDIVLFLFSLNTKKRKLFVINKIEIFDEEKFNY